MVNSRRDKIRQGRLWSRIALVATVLLSILMYLSSKGLEYQPSPARAVAEDGVSVVLTYASMPLRGIEAIASEIKQRSQAVAENKRLNAELMRLKDVEIRNHALSERLAGLEKILNVDQRPDFSSTRIAARAIAEAYGPFVHSALINAGANKAVKRGYPVMTPDGFYGHVVRVGRLSSRVLKLTDLNSRIAVMSLRSGGRAIMIGDNTEFPILSFVADASEWQVGDRILTSGDDGVLPQGLPIGVIARRDGETFKIRPFINDNRVDWVLVYPFMPVPAPEDEPDITPETGTETASETAPQTALEIEQEVVGPAAPTGEPVPNSTDEGSP